MSRIICGDALETLKTLDAESVQCCVTSPPYWGLRDYGVPGQLGLEWTPEEYVTHMVEVFREVRRVLRDDGTLWLDMGDSYATGAGKVGDCPGGGEQGENWPGLKTSPNRMPIPGLKPKDLCGIPWRLAFALQADGWYLRSDIIWYKPNPMPESVTDRPTKAHEYVFLLSKSSRYYFDAEAIKEPCQSGPSDIRKMVESLPRIGGKHKDLIDPLSMASSATNIGRKRSVGGSHRPGGWNEGPTVDDKVGRYPRKQDQTAAAMPRNSHRAEGFNERWDASEDDGTAPLYRNARTVWTIATAPFKGAHFATFPEELARRCIAAGTSTRGACPECGAPWRRVVERGPLVSVDGTADDYRPTKSVNDPKVKGRSEGWTPNHMRENLTTGWALACSHGLEPVPCLVLDPFAGAGTVGLVARGLGREYVLIEIKPEYVEMARARIEGGAPLFAGAREDGEK